MAIAMGWHKPDNVAGSSAPAIMVGLFVATGGLLFGYDTGSINGILAMRPFIDQFNTGYVDSQSNRVMISPDETALIVAILSAGTFVGALLSAPVADWIGRRISLIISIGVFCFGVIFQVWADQIPMMVAGRFFAGVGVGAVSVQVPLYQSEMAPKWIRGTLMDGPAAYRIPLGLQFTWACVLAVGLLVLPETPRYLIKRGQKQEAGVALSRLRRLDIYHPALVEELAEIEANHEYELTLGPDTYRDIFLGSPHLGRHDPFLISLVMNIVNVVSTIPGLFVVESWGRRKLLIVGSIGMAICQLTIAVAATIVGGDLQEQAAKIMIVFVSIFIFFYAASWGPVCWVVTSEIYPLKVRAKAMSVSTASNWLLNFGIAYGTPYMVGNGEGYADLGTKVFYVWGAFCILAGIFVYCMVYETSKISLEQIDEMYERVAVAWKSKDFEPSWSFQQLRDEGFVDSGIPPAEHELQPQPSSTSSTTATSIDTIHSSEPDTAADNRTEEDKAIRDMGLGNVDFSY
ncbi:hypothetical protein DL768_010192 [Monosporascus sp. mg162]|nr:hypothetical protein DL768_010192 [Monosporascus sp. mg162]